MTMKVATVEILIDLYGTVLGQFAVLFGFMYFVASHLK